MRFPLPHLLAATMLFCLAGSDALAQVERGGGLFSRNRNSGQISAGLFPDAPSTPAASQPRNEKSKRNEARTPRRGGLSIFRSGTPEQVEPTAYVIADGQRIPVEGTPVSSEPATETAETVATPIAPGVELATAAGREPAGLGGLFSFGRRESRDEARESAPIVETVAAPIIASPTPASPAPRAASASTPGEIAEAPVAQPTAPASEDARERRGLRLAMPFFNRRDRSDQEEIPTFAEPDSAPLVAQAVPAASAPASSTPSRPSSTTAPPASSGSRSAPASSPPAPAEPAATVAAAAPSTAAEAPASAAASGSSSEPTQTTSTSSDGRPEFVVTASPDAREELPRSERGGGISIPSLPNPISAIRPNRPSRPVDLTNAETIIEGGEIVAEGRPTNEATVVTSQPSGPREAPRTVDGVTTYSSWSDVGGRSVSAADRILSQMR